MVGDEIGLAAQEEAPGRSPSRVDVAGRSQHKRRSSTTRVVGCVLSLALIVFIFVGVIPQFASYEVAWEAISQMSSAWWLVLVIGAALYDISFAWPYQAVLPGLRYRHGYMETQTTSAISNTVPAGGAVAIGMTFRMFESFNQSDVAISTAVVATGIWNLGFKFGLPIVAVTLVLLTGQNTAGTLALAALGVVIIVIAGIVIWLTLRDDRSAQAVGRLGDRVVNWFLQLLHREPSDRIERAIVRFRAQTSDILHERAGRLTVSVLASQLANFATAVVVGPRGRDRRRPGELSRDAAVLLRGAAPRRDTDHTGRLGHRRCRAHRDADRVRGELGCSAGGRSGVAGHDVLSADLPRRRHLRRLAAGHQTRPVPCRAGVGEPDRDGKRPDRAAPAASPTPAVDGQPDSSGLHDADQGLRVGPPVHRLGL